MAKNNRKKVTVEVSATQVPQAVSSPDNDWRTKDDAGEIMRVASLLRDKPRWRRATDLIRGATAFITGRKTGRKATRSSGR